MPKPFTLPNLGTFVKSTDTAVEKQNIYELIGSPMSLSGDGNGVKIAVLGTGVADHDNLPQIVHGVNLGSSKNSRDASGLSHAMCGLIGAADDIIGIAPGSILFCAKVTNDRGHAKPNAVTAALMWCLAAEVDIIVMPLVGPSGNSMVANAMKKVAERKILVIANAGYDYQPIIPALHLEPHIVPTTYTDNRHALVNSDQMGETVTAAMVARFISTLPSRTRGSIKPKDIAKEFGY